VAFQAPDLVPPATLPAPPAVEVNGTLSGYPPGGWDLVNQGNAAATAENFELRHGFYLCTQAYVDQFAAMYPHAPLDVTPCEPIPEFHYSQDNTLEVGATEHFEPLDLTIPVIDPGWYYLVLFADDFVEVSEMNEVNNRVKVPIEILPDSTPDWLFIGFDNPWVPYQPINAGSALPMKWHYADPVTGQKVASFTTGLEITATGYASCDLDGNPVGNPIADLSLPEDAGSSDLRYVSGDWQLNWDTSGQPAGCYFLSIFHPETRQTNTSNADGEMLAIVLH
jgi:hypothetical protein